MKKKVELKEHGKVIFSGTREEAKKFLKKYYENASYQDEVSDKIKKK